MSRLDTQQRLSQGPRPLELPRSFLASPQRIAPASTANLGSILQGAIQVSAQVAAAQRAEQQQADAEDFQTTLNHLNTQKAAYDRGEIPSSQLLQDYEAATQRFEDPRQQAQLIQFGEPFKTRLVEEAEAQELAGAQGFINTKLTELSATLMQDEEFVGEVSQLPYAEQLEAIRGELYQSVPPEMLQTIQENPRLQAAFTQRIVQISGASQSARQQALAKQEQALKQYAVDDGVSQLLDGADPQLVMKSLNSAGIPEEDVISDVAESLVGNIQTAEDIGSLQELGQYLKIADDVLSTVPDRYGKERAEIASAMSRARQSIGNILTTTLINRANVARGAGAEFEAVQGAVVDTLLSEASVAFGREFDTEQDLLAYQPQNTTEEAIHSAMLGARNAVQQEVSERTKTVNNAIAASLNPDNAPTDDVVAPLAFGPEDLTQYLDGLQQSTDDPDTLRLVDSARTSRSSLYHLTAALSNDTSGAGAVARAAGNEHLSGDVVTEAGLQQVFAAMEGLGGDENTHLIVDGAWDKNYALSKVYNQFVATGDINADLYNSSLQQYRQAQFETKSGERQSLATALQDQKVFKKITGKSEGQFTPQQLSILMQTMNIGALDETGNKRDTDYIANKAKEAMEKTGIYPVVDSSLGDERRFIGFTSSKAVPEAIGKDTELVERGMNNYLSRADRFIASHMTDGEYGSLSQYAYDLALDGLDDARKEALTFREFQKLQQSGDARIVLNSAAAGESVPVVLVLTQDGRDPRNLVLGSVNFSDSGLSSVVKDFGSEAFRSPRKKTDHYENAMRGLNSAIMAEQYTEGAFDTSGTRQFQGP